jgi:amidase
MKFKRPRATHVLRTIGMGDLSMNFMQRSSNVLQVGNATINDLQEALASRQTTAVDLVRTYAARINAYDRAGPNLNAVRQVNPDALAIAESLDANPSGGRRQLEGIPILIKDNIATGDAQPTTVGSLALADAHANRDAKVVRLLREAGAVILGKSNLTEFASVLTVGMPGGYSSIAGQVRNPYAPQLDQGGIAIVSPGGSSSGSAVAVAAGFAAAAIGTETSGSLLSPANQNAVVTVKPTVGLISRAGIVPIDRNQDTVGPLTRTVRDAAILLNVLVAPDPEDDATLRLRRPDDYTSALDRGGLRGARIGIPDGFPDEMLDEQIGRRGAAAVMRRAHEALEDLGATLVRGSLDVSDLRSGFGSNDTVLKLYSNKLTGHQFEQLPVFLPAELKQGLNAYLRDWITGSRMRTIADIIAFNKANADSALRFGQKILDAAEQSRTPPAHTVERCKILRVMYARAIVAFMDQHQLDAVLFPGYAGAGLAAKAGFPSVHVPAGIVSGVGSTSTPDYPFGITFTGRAWDEPVLLRLAYAFEQGTKARSMPRSVPPLW